MRSLLSEHLVKRDWLQTQFEACRLLGEVGAIAWDFAAIAFWMVN